MNDHKMRMKLRTALGVLSGRLSCEDEDVLAALGFRELNMVSGKTPCSIPPRSTALEAAEDIVADAILDLYDRE